MLHHCMACVSDDTDGLPAAKNEHQYVEVSYATLKDRIESSELILQRCNDALCMLGENAISL